MPEVRRRKVSPTTKTTTRRRDRVRDEDDEIEEEEEAPRRRRTTSTAKRTTRRVPEPPDDDEEDEDVDDEYEDDEEDIEDEDEYDDEEEEEEAVRPARRPKKKAAPARSSARKKPPTPGIRSGLAGIREMNAMVGGRAPRVPIGKEPVLFRALETEPFLTFAQHWLPTPGARGPARGDRPHTCIEKKKGCPICAIGNNPSLTIVTNVFQLSGEGAPRNAVLQIGITAWNILEKLATRNGKLDLERSLWAVNRSGNNTNFQAVKERDLREDWGDDVPQSTRRNLAALIEEAKEEMFDDSIVYRESKAELKDLADHWSKYDDDDDEDEYDDDDD